ncbi:MAG: hypothetical protein D6706_15480 [Chloroflexi bacterium]|nr:MAG: hypothetical protein D6706_15480 [Chloroflexota bacterium]
MGTVIQIHQQFANTVWLFFLILGVWGIWRAVRKQGVDGSYLGALVIGEIVYAIQGVLGLILWLNGLLAPLERPFMHVLYGIFALLFLPFVYFVWLKGDDSNRAQWVLGLATLFLFGIALRAISTGI